MVDEQSMEGGMYSQSVWNGFKDWRNEEAIVREKPAPSKKKEKK